MFLPLRQRVSIVREGFLWVYLDYVNNGMTLGFFPTPYPNELLYSVCARYGALVQYPSTEAINVELFGRRGVAAIIDLPSHLGYLTSQFPSGHQLPVSRLVK